MSLIYVVTGASRGIGHELVKQLLAAGHNVVATARSSSPTLTSLATSAGGKLIILKLDLASAESVKNFGKELSGKIPRIDVLINNAGICTPQDFAEDPSTMEPKIILEQFTTNVLGTLLVTQATAPFFHSETKIINISSMVSSFAITKSMQIASVGSYSISKVALNMLTVKQAFFYKDAVVIALDPGLVRTDMNPNGPSTVEDTCRSIIGTVDGLQKEDSGSFVNREGTAVGW